MSIYPYVNTTITTMAGFGHNKTCHVYLPYRLDGAYFVFARLRYQIMYNNYKLLCNCHITVENRRLIFSKL